MSATACSRGSPYFLTALCAIGQQVWNFGIITNLPMPLSTSIRPTSWDRRFIMVANAGGPLLDSFISYQLDRRSVRITRSLPRTTVTSLAMSTKNITCASEWGSTFSRGVKVDPHSEAHVIFFVLIAKDEHEKYYVRFRMGINFHSATKS